MDRTSGFDMKGQVKLKTDICGAESDITFEPHINIIWTKFQNPVGIGRIRNINIRESERQATN